MPETCTVTKFNSIERPEWTVKLEAEWDDTILIFERDMLVACVWPTHDSPDAKKNAALIAAAPELAEALENTAAILETLLAWFGSAMPKTLDALLARFGSTMPKGDLRQRERVLFFAKQALEKAKQTA